MAEVELPDPKEVKEKAGDPFTRTVALFVAVYAVALAVTALGGSNAAKEMVMAQQKASNQWAYYQAKVVRENLYLLEAEKLELELEVRGAGLSSDDRRRLDAVRDRYKKKAETYKHEKEEIMAEARKQEEERDIAARRDPYFDYAEVLLQIGIVLASVAMLSGKRWAFFVSLGLGVLGLFLCANGYGLLLKVPGLE
jgi:ABC-type multidrug transport system fused ATPase/permease subunit